MSAKCHKQTYAPFSFVYGTSSFSLGDGLTVANCPRCEALEKAVAHAAQNLRHLEVTVWGRVGVLLARA
jgi:hypothetical protein